MTTTTTTTAVRPLLAGLASNENAALLRTERRSTEVNMTPTTSSEIVAAEAGQEWLTDEQCAAIEATLPQCPECGSGISWIHFISHENHRFFPEISCSGGIYRAFDRVIETGQPLRGELNCYSQHYDTIDREPNLAWKIEGGRRVELGVEVECENGHSWNEPRLKERRRSGDDTDWEVLP